jgi:DNA-directed RNA polymerase I subunit RPA2
MPEECRISRKTYSAPLLGTLARTIDDGSTEKIRLSLGEIPIIVMSDHCHLSKLNSKELV